MSTYFYKIFLPALHKLEKQQYIESYWHGQAKGPAGKYYKIMAAVRKS